MKLYIKENDYSKYQKHWDDIIDVDGIKYNYDDIVAALLYMYGLDTMEKAAEAYISGKFTDREIKRALIYWDTQGLPWKERNVIFDRTCKKLHLEQIVKENDYSETDEFTLIKEMNHWIKDLKEFFVDDSKAQKAIADYFYYDDGAHQEDFKELQASVKTLHKLWLKLDGIVEESEEKENRK